MELPTASKVLTKTLSSKEPPFHQHPHSALRGFWLPSDLIDPSFPYTAILRDNIQLSQIIKS